MNSIAFAARSALLSCVAFICRQRMKRMTYLNFDGSECQNVSHYDLADNLTSSPEESAQMHPRNHKFRFVDDTE